MNMKYCHGFFLSVFIIVAPSGGLLSGQTIQAEIDTLWQRYRAQTEVYAKIDLLNDISYAYRRLNPDSVLKYAEQALEWAGKIDYTAGMAYAYKNKGIANYKLGSDPDTTIGYYQKA
ncbi:MAG: hypothetical protein KDD04_10855, partial [Sinomicrobium sp.]|nr:hypothetical protein [Sinomicrobium sp.]